MRLFPLSLAALPLAVLAFAGGARAEEESPSRPPVAPQVANDAGARPTEEQVRIQQAVDALRPVVAEMRGLDWKHPVEAAVMSRQELRAYMLEEMSKEVPPEQWARDQRILRRLGMLGPEEDLRELVLQMYQTGVAGFYDPQTKKLFVIEGLDVEGQKPTMIHELTHAIEDQHFDLEAMEKPYRENDPDRQFAIRCLWEGSAEYARRRYEDAHPEVSRHAQAASAKRPDQAKQHEMMRKVPAHLLLATLLHYRTGPNFVSQVLDRYGYKAGMQRLLDDPPTSQEQLLHPWKWLGHRRDLPRIVTFPEGLERVLGEGWKKLDEHSVGELDLAVYLDYFLGDKSGRLNERLMGVGKFVDARSHRAASGWDAGRTLYLEDGEENIVVLHAFAFDTLKDAEDAARHLGAARRKASPDSWKGEGWVKDEDAEVLTQSYDYTCRYGKGRILQRGRDVLVLEGAPADRFEPLWNAFSRTTIEKQPGDQGDDPADPFAGYAVVDRQRGLGLMLPGPDWSADKGGRAPAFFATAHKGELQVTCVVLDQATSEAGLPGVAKMVLGPMFRAARAGPARAMGRRGLTHPMPAAPGHTGRLYVASDAARTYLFIVGGPTPAVTAADGDLQRLLTGMQGPLGAAPSDGPDLEGSAPAGPPAGLRSIPGY